MRLLVLFMIGAFIALVVFVFKKDEPPMPEPDQRKLKNIEVEMKLENFFVQYHRLRSNDFEGAFIIQNHTRDKWFFGSSKQVYHELMEIVSGNAGPRGIYDDIRMREEFRIRVAALRGSGCKTRDELSRALEATYGTWRSKY